MQAFEVTRSLESILLKGNYVKDVLDPSKVILFTDDIKNMIYIYQGCETSLVLYFIALELAKEIRLKMRGFYKVHEKWSPEELKQFQNEPLSEMGKIQEFINPKIHQKEDGSYDTSFTNKYQINATPGWSQRLYFQDMKVFDEKFPTSTFKLLNEELNKSDTNAEMILINNKIYSPRNTLDNFFPTRSYINKYEETGKIPDGLFFCPDYYGSRIFIANGRIQAIQFLSNAKDVEVDSAVEINYSIFDLPKIQTERPITKLHNAFNMPSKETLDKFLKNSHE